MIAERLRLIAITINWRLWWQRLWALNQIQLCTCDFGGRGRWKVGDGCRGTLRQSNPIHHPFTILIIHHPYINLLLHHQFPSLIVRHSFTSLIHIAYSKLYTEQRTKNRSKRIIYLRSDDNRATTTSQGPKNSVDNMNLYNWRWQTRIILIIETSRVRKLFIPLQANTADLNISSEGNSAGIANSESLNANCFVHWQMETWYRDPAAAAYNTGPLQRNTKRMTTQLLLTISWFGWAGLLIVLCLIS